MPLPKTESAARRLPAALEANAASEGLRLKSPQVKETGSLSLSPIEVSALDDWEDFYQSLRRQDRSIKRYAVMEAVLRALKDDGVRRAVIERL